MYKNLFCRLFLISFDKKCPFLIKMEKSYDIHYLKLKTSEFKADSMYPEQKDETFEPKHKVLLTLQILIFIYLSMKHIGT